MDDDNEHTTPFPIKSGGAYWRKPKVVHHDEPAAMAGPAFADADWVTTEVVNHPGDTGHRQVTTFVLPKPAPLWKEPTEIDPSPTIETNRYYVREWMERLWVPHREVVEETEHDIILHCYGHWRVHRFRVWVEEKL